jgi:hypothetical protein
MPPPSDPAEIICMSITPGKTSAIPASASVPKRETQNVSISPVLACASMTTTLGQASFTSSGTIGAYSSARVRGSRSAAGAAGSAAADTTAVVLVMAAIIRH